MAISWRLLRCFTPGKDRLCLWEQMINVVEIILSPIIWLMDFLLGLYVEVIGSLGFSILLLSVTFSLLLIPFSRMGHRLESRIGEKMKVVSDEVQHLKQDLKGEKLFLATEAVYKKHGYHPIHSVAMSASFLVVLPVLLAAIFLFSADGVLSGQSFLFIRDLSKPDGILGPINLLPLLMFSVTFIDARLRFSNDAQSRRRFMFISVVLLVLVYALPAGLVLYWTGNNIMSFILARTAIKSGPSAGEQNSEQSES